MTRQTLAQFRRECEADLLEGTKRIRVRHIPTGRVKFGTEQHKYERPGLVKRMQEDLYYGR